MSLQSVRLNSDVYMVCLQHALSTEKEEVMGMLIGEIDIMKIAHISAVLMMCRSDKRKDRVEISPEQLSTAAIHAEKLSEELKKPMRVLGWYHSHPHITVWPSHIDIRTQHDYQALDKCFVGIIISVFTEDKATKEQQIQVTCFQSVNTSMDSESPQYSRHDVPLYIVPTSGISLSSLKSMVELPDILYREELDTYLQTTNLDCLSTLSQLNNQAVLTKNLCHITEAVCGPLYTALEQRKATNLRKIKELQNRRRHLEEVLSDLDKKVAEQNKGDEEKS